MERNQDYVLDSNEQCFLCLGHVMIDVKLEDDESSVVSIQSLCRYLKIDIKRLLLLTENSSLQTFANNLKDVDERCDVRLKVWLCGDCSNLNRKVTEVCKELEKIEMMLKYNLNSIHEKLNGSAQSNMNTQLCNILRDEVIRKCAAKLDNISPRVLVRQQSIRSTNEEKPKPDLTEDMPLIIAEAVPLETSRLSFDDIPHSEEEEMIHVKEEFPLRHGDIEDSIADLQVKEELDLSGEGMSNYEIPPDEDIEIKMEDSVAPTTHPATKTSKSKSTTPTKRPDKSYTIDSSTGQYHCKRCPETFPNYHQQLRHYEKVHVKAKFSCNSCDSQFNCRTTLERHHLTHHMGVRFLCNGPNCSKTFTLKHNLYEHQRVTGCGRGVAEGGEEQPPENVTERHTCHYKNCGKEFSRARDLRRHLNSIHLEIRAHECKLCGKKFQRKYQVGQHVRAIHEKTKKV